MLYILLICSFLSLILCFIQSNKQLFPRNWFTSESCDVFIYGILNIHWLDYSTGITLLGGLFALLFARYQFALSQMPVLGYNCLHSKTSDFNLIASTLFDVVTIENIGSGIAVVSQSQYRISYKEEDLEKDYRTYSEVVKELTDLGYTKKTDYWLNYFSKGYTFSSNSCLKVLEMPRRMTNHFFAFDIKISYYGLLGDRYEKEIYCIPRPFERT